MSAAIASIISMRTTAGMSVGEAAKNKSFAKEPHQPNIQSERVNHVPQKIANMNFSFNKSDSALTVAITDSASGEILRKILYDRALPTNYLQHQMNGHVIDVCV